MATFTGFLDPVAPWAFEFIGDPFQATFDCDGHF